MTLGCVSAKSDLLRLAFNVYALVLKLELSVTNVLISLIPNGLPRAIYANARMVMSKLEATAFLQGRELVQMILALVVYQATTTIGKKCACLVLMDVCLALILTIVSPVALNSCMILLLLFVWSIAGMERNLCLNAMMATTKMEMVVAVTAMLSLVIDVLGELQTTLTTAKFIFLNQ